MSTYMEKKGNVVRKWYVVDAAGKPLGKTAVIVADLLRGRASPPTPLMPTAVTTSSSSTPARPSSPATRWSRSTTAPTPAGWAA